MSRLGPKFLTRRILLAGTFIVLAVTAGAEEPALAPPADHSLAGGLAVYLDRDGHPIFPGPDTPRVTLPVAPAHPRAPAAPSEIEAAPGGGKMVRVAGRLATMSVAHVAADGGATVECVDEFPASRSRNGDPESR